MSFYSIGFETATDLSYEADRTISLASGNTQGKSLEMVLSLMSYCALMAIRTAFPE